MTRTWVAVMEDKILNFVPKVTRIEVSEEGLWYNGFFCSLRVQEVHSQPLAHGTLKLSLEVRGSRKNISLFVQIFETVAYEVVQVFTSS